MEDWKDRLAALAASAPADEPESQNDDTPLTEGAKSQATAPQKEPLHVVIDKKGRKGKVATIIEGFTMPDEEVAELASFLKQKIGVGGSSRGGEILLQGECREKAIALLKQKGYKTKG